MKTWIKITTLLYTTIACVHGEYKNSVMVSYETAEGWSKNALAKAGVGQECNGAFHNSNV